MALFEFQSRWAQLASGDLRDKEDELEARDTSLEQFIHDYSCGDGLDFRGYPYRWPQILTQTSVSAQIQMLEERDRAIENYFFRDGRCPLEIPYRWAQIWEPLLDGEAWAIACLEENDRAIEGLFAQCTCGKVSDWIYQSFGEVPGSPGSYQSLSSTAVPEAIPAGSILEFAALTTGPGGGTATCRLIRVSDSFVLATKSIVYVGSGLTVDTVVVPSVADGTTVIMDLTYAPDSPETVEFTSTWFSGVLTSVDDVFTPWDV